MRNILKLTNICETIILWRKKKVGFRNILTGYKLGGGHTSEGENYTERRGIQKYDEGIRLIIGNTLVLIR